MKNKLLVLIAIIIMFFMTGCSGPIEKVTTNSNDTILEFETFYKGYIYLDENDFSCDDIGYDYPENTFIQSKEQLDTLIKKTGFDFQNKNMNFDEYLLYVETEETLRDTDTINTFDISKLSYNENTFDVLISYKNKEEIKPKKDKWICFYNISKVKKNDFPFEKRDYIKHQDYN